MGAPMKALVCGSRSWQDAALLWATLDEFHRVDPIEVVVHGCAKGADTIADEWAVARGVGRECYPADWDRYRGPGKNPAGPIRNRAMLKNGNPDVVIAFSRGTPGTADMIALAQAAEIPVYVVLGRQA